MKWPTFTPIEWTCVCAMGAYAALLAWKARAAFAYLRMEREAFPDAKLGSAGSRGELTVLQPIDSGDPTLERCLRSSADLARPDAQFIWLLNEGDEEAHRVASALERPGVTIQQVPAAEPGRNPKIDKLARAIDGVRTEYVAVLDGDTAVRRQHLQRAIQVLRSSAGQGGLYTGLPTSRAEQGSSGANLLVAFVNSSSPLAYLPQAHAGPPLTLNGKFYVTRTSDLRDMGGFSAIASQLCDDRALARLYRTAGRPIYQGGMAHLVLTGPLGMGAYFQQMQRWFAFALFLMRDLETPLRLRLAWTLGAPPILLWMALAGVLMNRQLAIPFAALLVARLWTLAALLAATREGERADTAPSRNGAEVFPISSILSELLQPLHFLHALFGPETCWRSPRTHVQESDGFGPIE